jgi:hypothetical protein
MEKGAAQLDAISLRSPLHMRTDQLEAWRRRTLARRGEDAHRCASRVLVFSSMRVDALRGKFALTLHKR